MSLNVFGVVLLAALFHAIWNFMVKRWVDPYQGMTAVVIGHLPGGVIALLYSYPFPLSGWPYIVLGALLHTGYQVFLLNAYRCGDLSLVYPMARGSAPLITALVSMFLLGEHYNGIQIAALFIIGSGIISLAFTVDQKGKAKRSTTTLLAVITAVFISSYSLVDGIGARVVGTALGFYGFLSIINALMFTGIIVTIRPGTAKQVLKHHLPAALLGGSISFLAYALVVWSFTKAPIALVAALRETSVIFALLLGIFALKEKLTWLKVCAVTLTFAGVILLRVG